MADSRIKDLETVCSVFEKFGVSPFLVYGALLGFYRDGAFLPGDDDIDLAVIEELDLQTRKQIGWMLNDLGFKSQPILFNVFQHWEQAEPGYNGDATSGVLVLERDFKFTVFFFTKEHCGLHQEEEYVCVPRLGAKKLIATPSRFFQKADSIKIGGKKYKTPSPIPAYLSYSYFDNWKDKKDRRHSPTYPQNHEIT